MHSFGLVWCLCVSELEVKVAGKAMVCIGMADCILQTTLRIQRSVLQSCDCLAMSMRVVCDLTA